MNTVITVLFFIALGANVIALARHWRMMRVMNIDCPLGILPYSRCFAEGCSMTGHSHSYPDMGPSQAATYSGSANALAVILRRCRTVLGNMALENETGLSSIFNRWPISHEPLRADAKNLVPLIDEALFEYHTAFLKSLNDYHDHHPLPQPASVAQSSRKPCKCGIMCQDHGEEGGCRYKQPDGERRKSADQ